MYAVIETGGKQYRGEVGTELEVELLDVEAGQTITLDRVFLVADGADAAVGTPVVENAAVEAEVVRRDRGEKVISFKYRPKARSRVMKGHRQELTILRIADIRFNGKSAAEGLEKAGKDKAADKAKLEAAAARQAAEDAALAAKLAAKAEASAAEAETPAAEADAPAEAETSATPKRTRAKAAEATPVDAPAAEAETETPDAAPHKRAARTKKDE